MDVGTFLRQCYLQTGGWIPMNPIASSIDLGDFCTIREGSIRPLGNILTSLNLREIAFGVEEVKLAPDNWKLHSGVHQVLCETEQSTASHATRQILHFDKRGSFLFHGRSHTSRMFSNWSEFADAIIIQLAQTRYAFRELYLITEIARFDYWSLAVAGKPNAQLETSTKVSDVDYFQLVSHETCQVSRKVDVDIYERSNDCNAHFFQAKKLVVSANARERLLNRLILDSRQDGKEFLSNWLDEDLLNSVKENELNSATCLNYFDWRDANLDDVERLC